MAEPIRKSGPAPETAADSCCCFEKEFHMSEEDLELLITLDDPEGAPEEDTFHHPHAEKATGRHDQREEESGGLQE